MARTYRGFSLIETLVTIAIIMALSAIAIVGYSEAQLRTREAVAVQHMLTLEKAQTQYFGIYQKYSVSMADLGPAKAALIPQHLADGLLGGYRFELTAESESFKISARPERFGKSGRRSFCTDETLVIRQTDKNQPAAPTDPPV